MSLNSKFPSKLSSKKSTPNSSYPLRITGAQSPPEIRNSRGEKGVEMGVIQLQRQWLDLTSALFSEGFLDGQFTQLQQLQDEGNPDFVVEVVTLFFEDSERLLNNLCSVLGQQVVDFKKVDALVHQLKGSSASIGAQRVKNVCISFRSCCEEGNLEGCIRCMQQLNQEYSLVKSKLENLLRVK